MESARLLNLLAGLGLCVTLVVILYLMISWPEESMANMPKQLRELAIADKRLPGAAPGIDQLIPGMEFRAQVQVYLMRVVLITLMINLAIFGSILWTSVRHSQAARRHGSSH
jgi:hypothetical protein